jgi:hypothetical protein
MVTVLIIAILIAILIAIAIPIYVSPSVQLAGANQIGHRT